MDAQWCSSKSKHRIIDVLSSLWESPPYQALVLAQLAKDNIHSNFQVYQKCYNQWLTLYKMRGVPNYLHLFHQYIMNSCSFMRIVDRLWTELHPNQAPRTTRLVRLGKRLFFLGDGPSPIAYSSSKMHRPSRQASLSSKRTLRDLVSNMRSGTQLSLDEQKSKLSLTA